MSGVNSILDQNLWTEVFRPNNMSQVLMVDRVRKLLGTGEVSDNILFSGSCGIGKTTITRILASKFYDVLTINASLERGIDIIRDKIVGFCSNASLWGFEDDDCKQSKLKLKAVILEESDNLTPEAWKSLRAIMEQYHKTVRFIANCNYENNIPDPILSRFTVIHLEPVNQAEEQELINLYCDRTMKILNAAAQIKAGEPEVRALVETYFPDMRSIVKKCQELKDSGVTELSIESLKKTFDHSELFNILVGQPNPWENYKYIISEWANKPEDGLLIIAKDFPEFLRNVQPNKIGMLPYILKACANYMDMETRAIDKLIPLLALVAEIQIILNSVK